MADQRQPFWFRLNWLARQQPPAQPQRPRATSQPTTSVPIQRPAFRPAGIAPPQPSPQQSQPPSKADSQPPTIAESPSPSPSSVANESLKVDNQTASTSSGPNSKPQSPPKSATHSTSTTRKPPSPTFVAIESPKSNSKSTSKSAPTSKPSSPSRVANDSPKTNQNSPTKTTAKSPPLGRPQSKVASSATQSPPKGDSKSKASSIPSPTTSSSSLPQLPSRLVSTPRRTTQKEPETNVGAVSQSPSSPAKPHNEAPLQELEPKVVSTSETTTKSTSEDDDTIAAEGREGSRLVNVKPTPEEIKGEPAPLEKLNSSSIQVKDQNPMRGESKVVVGDLFNEEKNNHMAVYKEETAQKTIIETPSSGNSSNVELQAVKTQQKREISEMKETLSTTSYIEKEIKTANTGTSFQNPIEEAAPKRREIKEDISRLVLKMTTGSQFDEKQVVVITLTGENRGASMLLSSDQAKKEASIHIHRGYKTDPDESPERATDGEAHTTNGKRINDKAALAAMASVNSNVQSINNSIVVEASVTGKDPGVHLVLSQNNSETAKAKANGKSEFMQTRKSEFTTSSAERLTHEPTVRRRCLRGLFLESSDSEPENPNKPRRHGCRYSCGEKSRDKRVHVI